MCLFSFMIESVIVLQISDSGLQYVNLIIALSFNSEINNSIHESVKIYLSESSDDVWIKFFKDSLLNVFE